jgi:predicted dehydrogenase
MSPDFQVSAIVETDRSRREWATGALDAPAYASLDEALTAHACDAALVATPPARQPQIVTALLSRGIPVLVEKPGAPTLAEAETLVAAAGFVPLRMALVRRYWARYERLKRRLIDEPEGWQIEIQTAPALWVHVDPTQIEGLDGLMYDLLPHAYDIATSSLDADLSSIAGASHEPNELTIWLDAARSRTITIRHGKEWVEQVTAISGGKTYASQPTQLESIIERALIRLHLQRPEQEVAFDRVLASFANDLSNNRANYDLLRCAQFMASVRALVLQTWAGSP